MADMDIRELTKENICDYEELERSDVAENVERDCFRGLMAYADDEAVGCIVWSVKEVKEDEFEEDIVFFSASNEEAYAALLKEHDGRIAEDDVSESYIEIAKMSETLQKVLKNADFSIEEGESRDIVVSISDLEKIALPKLKVPSYIKELALLDELDYWNGVTYTLYHGRKGLLDDMDTLPLSWYDSELSCCVMTDGWIEGMLLVHLTDNDVLMPVLFFCNGRNNKKNLLYMMKHAIKTAIKNYPEKTQVLLRRHDSSTRSLIGYLLPKAKGKKVIIGRRST